LTSTYIFPTLSFILGKRRGVVSSFTTAIIGPGAEGNVMSEPDTSDATTSLLLTVATAAEGVMTDSLKGAIHLGPGQLLGGEGRRTSTIRYPVLRGPAARPSTVVVKRVGGYQQRFDMADAAATQAARRLSNEWAGLQFLEHTVRAAGQPPLSPRCFGGDHAAGLVVFEDLGDSECLADLLQGNDPARAEACLLAYAVTLGRMHAATAGRAQEYQQLRVDLGFGSTQPDSNAADWLKSVEEFRNGCLTIGLALPAEFASAMQIVTTTLLSPGPFLAFTPQDSCPDNHRFIDGQVRLFDFEGSTFRHALLDATYCRVPFPSCWCVNRLPEALVPRFEAAYREELVKGCPDAADDETFGHAMVVACVYWTIATISWNFERVLEEDHRWGIATVRQRHLLRLETLAAATKQLGYLESLGAFAQQMQAKLATLWPVEAMPLYPAFR
jgi:hypothetical protein